MILSTWVKWVKDQAAARLGAPYVYGGVYANDDTSQGADCSGVVGWVLEALTKGPNNMSWAHVVSTESWPYDYDNGRGAVPGTVGPYGTIAVSDLSGVPADAALTINIMHDGGGENSHMNCVVSTPAGTIIESNGDHGSCTNDTGAYSSYASLWTDHWYLPGPIVNGANIVTLYYPDVSNNNWSSNDDLTSFLSQLSGEGFAAVVHKVSEGSDYADPYWPVCQQWCEKNGLLCLGYHYVKTDDPAAQAAKWKANNGGANAMLDFEANSGNIDNFWNVVNAFNDAGINVSLAYIPHWYWDQIGQPDLSDLSANQISLVSSNYPDGSGYASTIYNNAGGDGGPGWASYGGATPTVWQFTDKATVAGHTVDCNAYLGASLSQVFGVSVPTPTPPAPPPPAPAPVVNPPAIDKPADPANQTSLIWDQLLIRWDMLGGRTVVEALAVIGEALKIPGFTEPTK